MATKDTDNEFEDLNDENTGDINEADDSFGLPDIDFDPIDSEKKPDDTPAEAPEESVTEPAGEEPYMYAHRTGQEDSDDIETTETESIIEEEVVSEETSEQADNIFGTPENEPESVDSVEESTEETGQEVQEYVPGSYARKQAEESSNSGVIIAVILALLVIGGGLFYFLYWQPRQAEVAAQEQLAAEEAAVAERQREEAAEAARLQQEEEAAMQAEADRLAAEEAEVTEGSIETISARTGRYYIIVASAIDGDLAMDYANELKNDGNTVKIIPPYGNVKFHRVAVSGLETLAEADTRANELKASFGDDVWIMKY